MTKWCLHFISNAWCCAFPVPTEDLISQTFSPSSHHLCLLVTIRDLICCIYSPLAPPNNLSPNYQRCTGARQDDLQFPCCDWLYYKFSVHLPNCLDGNHSIKNSSEERKQKDLVRKVSIIEGYQLDSYIWATL